jgi:hypothetical protein
MKLIRLPVAGAAIAVGLTILAPSLSGQDAALRYRWTKGQSLRYRTTQESNVVMSGIPGAGDMAITTTITEVHAITPSDVAADGTATLQLKFESMKVDVASPMGSMTIDSAASGAAADPMVANAQKILAAVVGESVTMVMAPTGAVTSVTGMARINEKLKSTLGAGAAPGILEGIGSMLTDDAFKGAMGQSFANLPDKVVKAGETWQSTLNLPNPIGAMTSTNTFTVKGVERVEGKDVTRVGIAQKIAVAPGGMIGPMSVSVNQGTGDGEMLIDHRLGQMVKTSNRLTLPMTMSMTGPDGSAVNLTGVMKTNVTATLLDR